MRIKFDIFIYSVFLLSLTILTWEYISTYEFHKNIKKNKFELKNIKIEDFITSKHEYKKSQMRASNSRMELVFKEIINLMIATVLVICFFTNSLRKSILNFCNRRMTIVSYNTFEMDKSELNYISLFLTVLIFAKFRNRFIHEIAKEADTMFTYVLFYLLLFCIIIPFFVGLIYNLVKVYKVSFIYALYIAYFIKAISEFFIQDEIDKSEFNKIEKNEFSKEVVSFLDEQGLTNKVYKEKTEAESINAALVGWGKEEHIEIYGNHGEFTDREFESVLMHEIGHSKDYSLHKKVLVLLFTKFLEMTIIVYIFKALTKSYTDDKISEIGCFIILVSIFDAYISKYINMLHKLTSQVAETNADLIAKKHGFSKELATVLFLISVKSNEYIKTTWLFNALTSFHPSIYKRLEYLVK